MREDLLDAEAAVHWGEAQLPLIGRRIAIWQGHNLERVVVDLNPQTGKQGIVARAKEPFPFVINAEAGAVIGSFRSALDLLAASLARRNGVAPSHETHFPIFRSQHDFLDPICGIESKKWLSVTEREIIKGLNPYDGGNDPLWCLHQLDILRKHERLIDVVVYPFQLLIAGGSRIVPTRQIQRLDNEPVICEFPRDTPEPDIEIDVLVTFNELGLGVYGKPLLPTLAKFQNLVMKIISWFD